MEFFNVISLENARRSVSACLDYINTPIRVSLADSLNKVLFCDVVSAENLPAFTKSAVDGYAVRAVDTYGATESIPSLLTVIGRVAMGEFNAFELNSGEACYVPTGGMLPLDSDSMVMIEHTDMFADKLAILKSVFVRENTIGIGDDVAAGAVVAKKNKVVTPLTMGVLAGLGVSEVMVYRTPSIYVISTGDELVDISDMARDGKIRDINSYVLSAMIARSDFTLAGVERVKDNFEQLKSAVKNAADKADIVLVSGGSSVGEKDFTCRVIDEFDGVFIKGIAIKPGKPTIVGKINGKLIFGLPGHPMACAIVYKALIEGALFAARGQGAEPKYFAEAASNFPSTPGRTVFQPVSCAFSNGKLKATAIFGKSGLISPLDKANGYIVIAENIEGIYEGQTVAIYSL